MLVVDKLSLSFQGIHAVQEVSFTTHARQVMGLIGPNGAGKTSLFNCITGHYRPSAGTVTLDGVNITGSKAYQIARRGIRRTFQNIRLFAHLSVHANILAGAYVLKQPETVLNERCEQLCEQLRIEADLLYRPAGELPYGVQRRLELARALIANPRLLLVDEPGAGLNGAERAMIVGILRDVAENMGIGVILIEHDIGMIARACDHVVVLNRGSVLAEGTPDEIQRHPAVVAAYLGD